jgi:hypothetical protein
MYASAVQSDAAGDVFVGGATYTSLYAPNQGAEDIFLQKYNSNGVFQWGTQFGTPLYDMLEGLAVSPGGISFVTSGPWAANYATPPAGTYTRETQVLANGAFGWNATLDPGNGTFPGGGGCGNAIDQNGNIFSNFTNYTTSGNTVTMSSYLSKTNSSGQVQWTKSTGASDGGQSATDSTGDVYVASHSLEKFDNSGNAQWTVNSGSYSLLSVCVGADGTVYAGGYGYESASYPFAGYLAAYSPGGTLLWSQFITPPAGSTQMTFDSLTISGNELVGAAELVNGGYDSGNDIIALNVPEPSCIVLLAGSALLLGIGRRKGKRN